MSRVVTIRDKQFVRRVLPAHHRRNNKTLSKTVQQLADERLLELRLGQFIPVDDSEVMSGGAKRSGGRGKASA